MIRPYVGGKEETVEWIVLAIGLLALLIYALLDTAKREDKKARRAQKSLDPFADVTTTKPG